MNASVVVVGAGIIGASTAYYLARAGVSVCLVDAKSPIASGTASQSSAGGVRHQGRAAAEIPLALYSIALWSHLEEELDADLDYRRDGMTVVTDDEKILPGLSRRIERERALGLEVQLIQGRDLHELVPGLPPEMVAGSYCSMDGHANPILATSALIAAAARSGAQTEWNRRALGLKIEKGRVTGVTTSKGHILCDQVILATGAWTPALAATAGLSLDIRIGPLQMMVTTPRPHVLDQVLGWFGHSISLKQVPTGGFVIGGGWPGTAILDNYQTTLQPGAMAKSARTATALFPSLREVSIVRAWVGIEGFTKDDQPAIGPVPGVDGLVVAAGFGGHGFALGPGVGALLGQCVVSGRVPDLLRPFSPARFEDRSKGSVA